MKGSLLQVWPSTGTTSVCPDSTTPPPVLPSDAGRVSTRLALVPVASGIRSGLSPSRVISSSSTSISSRLEFRLVVSIATSRSIQGREAGREFSGIRSVSRTPPAAPGGAHLLGCWGKRAAVGAGVPTMGR